MKPVLVFLSRHPNVKEKESLSLIKSTISIDGKAPINKSILKIMSVKGISSILFFLEEENSI